MDQKTSHQRSAIRFFWSELILVAAMSIAGNITHAVINAPAGRQHIAAFVASFPPIALLAATHGVGVLAKASEGHNKYAHRTVVALTSAIAAIAFRLSFDALKDLTIQVGVSEHLAFLMPLIVDGAIGQATIALLVLARTCNEAVPDRTGSPFEPLNQTEPERFIAVQSRPVAVHQTEPSDPELDGGIGGDHLSVSQTTDTEPPRTTEPAPVGQFPGNPPATVQTIDPRRWQALAEHLCNNGITGRSDPTTVAAILQLRHERGLAHSAIARHVSVSKSTVTRTLTATAEYTTATNMKGGLIDE